MKPAASFCLDGHHPASDPAPTWHTLVEGKQLSPEALEAWPFKEGPLEKKSPSAFAGWQQRRFVIAAGTVSYYDHAECKGTIMLTAQSKVLRPDAKHNDPKNFDLSVNGRSYHMRAASEDEAAAWHVLIEETVGKIHALEESLPGLREIVSHIHLEDSLSITKRNHNRLMSAIQTCKNNGLNCPELDEAITLEVQVSERLHGSLGGAVMVLDAASKLKRGLSSRSIPEEPTEEDSSAAAEEP